MNFPLDSSTQTNTALATTGTSYTYVNTNDLSTKQNVLDASTNLLGIGTSISALNYLNISVNKPTNFQSDWNSYSRLSGTVRWLWNSRPGNAGLAASDPAPSRARRR